MDDANFVRVINARNKLQPLINENRAVSNKQNVILLFVFSYKNALTFAFGYMMIIEKQMSTDQSERKRQEKISLSRRLS